MKLTWKTEELGDKLVPVPICPPKIPHGLTRNRTWASAVRGQRLTAWAWAVLLNIQVFLDVSISLCKQFQIFRKIVVHRQGQAVFLNCMTLKMKALRPFVRSGTVYLMTQSNIPEDLKLYNMPFPQYLRIKRIIPIHAFFASFLQRSLSKKKLTKLFHVKNHTVHIFT
jgi:hypothetical protein